MSIRRELLSLTLLLSLTMFAFGQTQRGSLRGIIFDANGAVIPGATIKVL